MPRRGRSRTLLCTSSYILRDSRKLPDVIVPVQPAAKTVRIEVDRAQAGCPSPLYVVPDTVAYIERSRWLHFKESGGVVEDSGIRLRGAKYERVHDGEHRLPAARTHLAHTVGE
jgi:hypothetical protein